MSKVVTLSNGHTVTFTEKYSRKADKAYWRAMQTVTVETEKVDGTVEKEIHNGNQDAAWQAAILGSIVSVQAGDMKVEATDAWIESLELADYDKLLEALLQLRKEASEAMAAGKKNG